MAQCPRRHSGEIEIRIHVLKLVIFYTLLNLLYTSKKYNLIKQVFKARYQVNAMCILEIIEISNNFFKSLYSFTVFSLFEI